MTTDEASLNSERQLAIYRHSPRQGERSIPFFYEALREKARQRTTHNAFCFVDGGAGNEDVIRGNERAFLKWEIVPRMLRDISHRDLGIEMLGERWKYPALLAPIGVQREMHPDGEAATARAAAEIGMTFVLSTVSSVPIEEVATASGSGSRWFQLYWSKDWDLTESFIRRAESTGYSSLVVTLDTQILGWRPRDLTNAHLPYMKGQGLANYLSDPVFLAGLPRKPEDDITSAVNRYLDLFSDLSRTWKDLARLKALTKLPLILKGIQHPDDAQLAIDSGADAVWVSNHGGRQVDGAIGVLDALVPVVEAVNGRLPVLVCSGVRRGADIYKALALGASAIGIGRPCMYGLAVNGREGVKDVLLDIMAEFDLTMALSGRSRVCDIAAEDLRRAAFA